MVSKAGRIYEEPRNLAEAAEFLRELSGGEFQFVTALAVMLADPKNAFDGRKFQTSHFVPWRSAKSSRTSRSIPY